MPDQKVHQIFLLNREEFKMKGVTKVDTFDDSEIILETNMGCLVLKGENLHINQLNLENGDMAVIGLITSMQYVEPQAMKAAKGKGKNILDRLLK